MKRTEASARILAMGLLAAAAPALLGGCAEAVVGGAVAGAAVVHDRRTPGTVIDDQLIELRWLHEYYSDAELKKQTHISATSFNGVVLLTGEAPTEALRARAEAIARRLPKVRRVHNEIRIAAPSSLAQRSSDALITAKVKTALFKVKLKGFDPTRVNVTTSNGTVYLQGLVTRAEADAVVEQVRRVKGVQRVVKVFEYIG